MQNQSAIEVIMAIRHELVMSVGICGKETHRLADLLEALEKKEVSPEKAVEEAMAIRDSFSDVH